MSTPEERRAQGTDLNKMVDVYSHPALIALLETGKIPAEYVDGGGGGGMSEFFKFVHTNDPVLTVPGGSATGLFQFASEVWSNPNAKDVALGPPFSTTVNAYEVPEDGVYQFRAQLVAAPGEAGTLTLTISTDAPVTLGRKPKSMIVAGQQSADCVATPAELTAGELIIILATWTGVGALSLVSGESYFSGEKVG